MIYESGFIDIKPISVNSCFQGRRFRTTAFKKWQEAVILSLDKIGKKYNGECKMEIYLYFKYPLKMDADNFSKAIIDCVVKKGIIKDDRYIFDLRIIKCKNFDIEGFKIFIEQKYD